MSSCSIVTDSSCFPNVQEPAQRAHFSKTAHAKLDHAPQASSAKILGPASHFQDLVSNANPLSTFQVDGSKFFYIRKVPSPLTEPSSSFPELPLS